VASAPPSRPRALTTSAALGVVGLVLLLAGFVTGSTGFYLASGLAAALSLVSALVWRSQLVEAWHAERKRR
jgi:membrane protein implicated in regulation of membrane protease activity